ncbi:Ribonuclease H-like domain,3'-5' exonuclease domain [Cinara cedri]|uniref:Ribonuclease H-like domain,3'-5' exonuclease domain n=1 Tax=Cinara cedri TaxID=506608 RepID=A0A5E4M4X0_9HEMI|nr:Ribonuclease H-like domain,3'-5' exonuclease domain [Cinara cedri]
MLYSLFLIVKFMMIKVLTKIPLIKSLVKLRARQITIVETVEQCEQIAVKLEKSSTYLPIIGLDCEWVSQNEIRHPVALLQISDANGICSLIRLSKFKTIPSSLSKILSNPNVIKVGVAISDDAHLLMNDYNLEISGYIDLRFLAREFHLQERSLAALAYKLLGCELDKDWRVRASDWEADLLSNRQIEYAALDAYIGFKILEKLRNKTISWRDWLFSTNKQKWDKFIFKYSEFKNVPFKNVRTNANINSKSKPNVRSYSTSTIKAAKVYDNCLMENIDGTVMSTCSHKKVDWYITQGLAELVNDNPRTIRLNFPADFKNRNDNFSVLPRADICTVCGRTEYFRKKSIIPKEFVRYMPTSAKSHITHDTLLLCYWCHIKSNTFDFAIRKQLFDKCQIKELNPNKYQKIPVYTKIMRSKSLAKTLLKSQNKLPDEVYNKLKLEIAEIYNIRPDRVFDSYLEILLTIKNLKYTANDKQQNNAAEKVVKHFLELDAINELKAIWRQHFLDTMKPKYLPQFWSVSYEG